MENSKNACILVVDDVPDTLNLLANWLEIHGYETLKATSGNQALRLAAEHMPDLILLDVMMPDMDGIETCRQLKTQQQTASIPVILVTAKDPGDARAEGMIAGAVDYLTKPVNLEDLSSRVESALTTGRDSAVVDVQRLLEEVAHTAMAMLDSALVWLLAYDDQTLTSEILTTSSGGREEKEFLTTIAGGEVEPVFTLDNRANPLIDVLLTRQTTTNMPISRVQQVPTNAALAQAFNQLNINYLTIVPLIAAGKTTGIMVLGYYDPHDMELPRAQQILVSFGSQAATALDYSRLITNLRQREEEALGERAFRQMIIDTMSDGLVVMDSQGYIRFTNRRLLRMTGYPEGYLEGRMVGELFHPDDRDEVMHGLLSESAATMKFDQRLITSTDSVIPVLISRSRNRNDPFDNQVIVLSDMTEQKHREYELERQTGHLMALNKAAQAMTSNLSLHEVLEDILNSATTVVEGQGASLFLVNRDNDDELLVVAAVGYRADEFIGLRVPLGEGLAGWVAREAQSQLVTDPDSDPRFYKAVDEQTGMSTRSLIAVPLVHGDQVIGVIEVVNKLNNGIFDAEDVRLLESMAGTAAVSIINARLYDQAQRRVSELATLLNASEAASSTLELDSVLEHIMHSLTRNLDVAQSIIASWHSPGRQITLLSANSHIYWPNTYGPLHPIAANSAMHTALIASQPMTIALEDTGLHPEDKTELQIRGMKSMLFMPVLRGETLIGVVTLASTTRATFAEEDCDTVEDYVQAWLAQMPEASPLQGMSESQMTDLASKLLTVPLVNWVTINSWAPGNTTVRTLYEVGFSEWTRQNGPSLNIDAYTTMKAVIENQRTAQLNIEILDQSTEEFDWLARRGGRSALMVPLVLHGSPIGIVILIDANNRIFDNEETSLAQGIANVVSNAIENTRLYQSLESRAKALESAYSELQEADHAKDQFIQNVSHELRTPLIHVMGYAELLGDATFGPINDEQHEALRSIAEKSQQIANIVEDMVTVQARESRTFDFQPIDLTALVKEALVTNRQRIETSGMRIVTHFPPGVPPVMADATAVTDTFNKLLDNALKFGVDGERIEIMIRDTEGPMVQVAIRDYGIGIPQREQSKVFQRFYQVDGSATRRYSGTGLGLAVAKAIIEAHGGKIGVTSKPGEGSIFYFYLPKQHLKRSTGQLMEQNDYDTQ